MGNTVLGMTRILVVDLEATCADDDTIPPESMETIEIGAVWVDLQGEEIARFQCFVRPVINPRLTPFCIGLTGIQQADVDGGLVFRDAAEQLRAFVAEHTRPDSFWASWGAYDRKQFERDAVRHGVPVPIVLPHLNAKRIFAKRKRIGKEVGLAKACQLAGLTMQGSHHRALDDALNVARLVAWWAPSDNLANASP